MYSIIYMQIADQWLYLALVLHMNNSTDEYYLLKL